MRVSRFREADRLVAGEEAPSDKGCGKTLGQRVAHWCGST